MSGAPVSVGEAFPGALARARRILVTYQEIGPVGRFGALMIERSISQAEQAQASGDPVAIIRAFKDLSDIKE